ncbi:MAG: hypothetical protein ABIP68_07845, partial [Ferruginibacter sp.]
NSTIMNLRSNRRQDFGTIQYKLEQDYKALLILDPESAILMGIGIVNKINSVKNIVVLQMQYSIFK